MVDIITLTRITRAIDRDLEKCGISNAFHNNDAHEALGEQLVGPEGCQFVCDNACIINDNAYALLTNARKVIATTQTTMEIVYTNYRRAGLDLHLTKAKTACTVSWSGAESVECPCEFMDVIDAQNGIPFQYRGQK